MGHKKIRFKDKWLNKNNIICSYVLNYSMITNYLKNTDKFMKI